MKIQIARPGRIIFTRAMLVMLALCMFAASALPVGAESAANAQEDAAISVAADAQVDATLRAASAAKTDSLLRAVARAQAAPALRAVASRITAAPAGQYLRTLASVQRAAAKVKLSKKSITLKAGAAYTLKATVSPKKKLVWSSSNEAVVKVSKTGRVTARKPGDAYIFVETKDGMAYAECAVHVKGKTPKKPGGDDRSVYFGSKRIRPSISAASLTAALPWLRNVPLEGLEELTELEGDIQLFIEGEEDQPGTVFMFWENKLALIMAMEASTLKTFRGIGVGDRWSKALAAYGQPHMATPKYKLEGKTYRDYMYELPFGQSKCLMITVDQKTARISMLMYVFI